jgi:hypothetical protein
MVRIKHPTELEQVAENIRRVADAVSPSGGGHDPAGGYVTCLTESVMGVTAGLVRIADAIGDLAAAVRETQGKDGE